MPVHEIPDCPDGSIRLSPLVSYFHHHSQAEESEHTYLATIFILRKMQISYVYHNYLGPVPIIALLQKLPLGGPLYPNIPQGG
jgi:hypothetical protein